MHGILGSLCNVSLLTNHGAFTIKSKVFDCDKFSGILLVSNFFIILDGNDNRLVERYELVVDIFLAWVSYAVNEFSLNWKVTEVQNGVVNYSEQRYRLHVELFQCFSIDKLIPWIIMRIC